MVINALEASEAGDTVKLTVEATENQVTFAVWNRASIPNQVAIRIFQRNFSTKQNSGRGLGTYSMKLFGEEVLGGKVGFFTSEEEGTRFYFILNR